MFFTTASLRHESREGISLLVQREVVRVCYKTVGLRGDNSLYRRGHWEVPLKVSSSRPCKHSRKIQFFQAFMWQSVRYIHKELLFPWASLHEIILLGSIRLDLFIVNTWVHFLKAIPANGIRDSEDMIAGRDPKGHLFPNHHFQVTKLTSWEKEWLVSGWARNRPPKSHASVSRFFVLSRSRNSWCGIRKRVNEDAGLCHISPLPTLSLLDKTKVATFCPVG